jgi:hypothetical protein
MSTWRDHIFRRGERYRVKADIKAPTGCFSEGEIVIFCDSSHSPYDSSSAFIFRSETSETKTWFLRDDAEDNSLELFEGIP